MGLWLSGSFDHDVTLSPSPIKKWSPARNRGPAKNGVLVSLTPPFSMPFGPAPKEQRNIQEQWEITWSCQLEGKRNVSVILRYTHIIITTGQWRWWIWLRHGLWQCFHGCTMISTCFQLCVLNTDCCLCINQPSIKCLFFLKEDYSWRKGILTLSGCCCCC